MSLRIFSLLFVLRLTECANILGVFVFPSISHQIVYQPIWRELSLRGHQVTVVTPDPLNDPTLTNLTEISVRFTYDFLKTIKMQEVMSKDLNIFQNLDSMMSCSDLIVEAELNSTQFQELINDESKHFDLILVEFIHPAMYALSFKYQAPMIGVTSFGAFGLTYDAVGNPTHPVLYPDMLLHFQNKDLSLWQKIRSVAFSLFLRHYYYSVFTPRAHEMAKRYFGDDIPYVGDLANNISMLFLNVNPLIYPPRPNVPAIVELGQMHIKPPKPLPQELQTILDKATEGVVYFSLGSNVKSVHLDPKLRKNIIDALSELPYKVLWKWESDHLPGRPDNVITRKWLPQQDLLAHKNIKAFVTQGGLQSMEEAISRTVPLVGMPFFGDQTTNVQRIVELGIGLGLDPATVTRDELKNAIVEVVENAKYKKQIEQVREILFDKPMTGLEKAVWWSEYVIRHKGARHLKSPTADVSWFDYFLLDVILAVTLVSSVVLYVTVTVIQKLIRMLESSHRKKLKSL